jgi:hypothetical protein
MQYVGVGLLTGGASVLTTVIRFTWDTGGGSRNHGGRDAGMEKKCSCEHTDRNGCLYAIDKSSGIKQGIRDCHETGQRQEVTVKNVNLWLWNYLYHGFGYGCKAV